MTADIIKFTKARKAKTRGQKEQQAIANRAKFGRTREEHAKEAANEKLAAQRLTGLRLKRPKSSGNEGPDEGPK